MQDKKALVLILVTSRDTVYADLLYLEVEDIATQLVLPQGCELLPGVLSG